MPRPRKLVPALFPAIAVIFLVTLFLYNREPRYNGRPLTAWLIDLANNQKHEQASQAIRNIGPDGIPHLIRMLRARDSTFKLKCIDWLQKQRFFRVGITLAERLQDLALAGFLELGPVAAPAVPQLISEIDSGTPRSVEYAIRVLGYIGPQAAAAVPSLVRLPESNWQWCVEALREIRSPEGIPFLISILQNQNKSNLELGWLAANALAEIGSDSQAPLIKLLTSSDVRPDTRLHAAWGLMLNSSRPSADLVPLLLQMIEQDTERTKLYYAALHLLGRIPMTAPTADQVLDRINSQTQSTDRLRHDQIRNGNFEEVQPANPSKPGQAVRPSDSGQVINPGEISLPGWSVYSGLIAWRTDNPVGFDGKACCELGPRAPAGAIAQSLLTTPGQNYEIAFAASSGSFNRNKKFRLIVGDLDQIIEAPDGPVFQPYTYPFKAIGPITTLIFAGMGNSGYGPIVDAVNVQRKTEPNTP